MPLDLLGKSFAYLSFGVSPSHGTGNFSLCIGFVRCAPEHENESERECDGGRAE